MSDMKQTMTVDEFLKMGGNVNMSDEHKRMLAEAVVRALNRGVSAEKILETIKSLGNKGR